MGAEDQILKGTKLITNAKNQRLKIQSRGQTLKKKLKIQNKINHKKYKIYIYESCFKNRVFFPHKVIVGYKNENSRSNKELIFF